MATRCVMFIFFWRLIALTCAYRGLSESTNSYVKTIEGVHGDIYDCVQVDKQPALTHHALFGHKIQRRPSKEFEEKLAKIQSGNGKKSSKLDLKKIWLSREGCPTGSIPLRRYSKSSKAFAPPGRLEFAGIHTSVKEEFHGASAIIDIYKPSVSDPNQFSAATIAIEKGEGPSLNQIQAGWMVNPGLYGDHSTRMYTYWTGGQDTGCYNTKCKGFISVDEKVPVDFVFLFTSILEGQQFDMKFSLNLDPKIGWWLTINENTNVGYWPNELFTSMNSTFGDTIRWGGQVFSPTSDSPPMGSGLFKNGNYNKTCYMRQVKANTANLVDVDNSFVAIAESRCYFTGNNSFKDDYSRYSFLFGGRGGGKFKCF